MPHQPVSVTGAGMRRVWVANEGASFVTVVDPDTNTAAGVIDLVGASSDVVFSLDGSRGVRDAHA